MAGKRRRSHKSSKVTDSEFDSKRYISNTLSQSSSSYSVPLTSELSEVSTPAAPKAIGTQGSHLPTSISSEIPRVKCNSARSRPIVGRPRRGSDAAIHCSTSHSSSIHEEIAFGRQIQSLGNTSKIGFKTSDQIRRRASKRSSHCQEDKLPAVSQDKSRATKRQRLSNSRARERGAYHSHSSYSKSSDRKRHSFTSQTTAYIAQNSSRTTTGSYMSKRSRRDRQRSVTSMTTTSPTTIKTTNTGDNVFNANTSNYSACQSLSSTHCTDERNMQPQVSCVQLPIDPCAPGVVICSGVNFPQNMGTKGCSSNDIHQSANPSNVPFYIAQKNICESTETQDHHSRLLNSRQYVMPDLAHSTESHKASSVSESKTFSNHSNSIQLRSSKELPTSQSEGNGSHNYHMPFDMTTNTPYNQISLPSAQIASDQKNQMGSSGWSSTDALGPQMAYSTASLPSSAMMAASLQTSSNYRKRTLESFNSAQVFHPSTSGSPSVSHFQNDQKSSTQSNVIPILPNACSPFLVSPAGSVSTNAPTAIQHLLDPVNVARLIALNQNMHSSTQGQNSSENQHSALSPRSLTSSFHPTASVSPGKYSRHSVHTAHSGSASTSKSVIYTRNHSNTSEWSNLRPNASNSGQRNPHADGINHRIAQLQQASTDRSVQLILLQDINQILLMDFEENLANLNVNGLVSCVLEILESQDEHLVELKNLSCNVLTHMMDVLPRSSDAIVPALPILLTTMSSSFVGDILERIINLLEQISRRHGKEVLKSGGVSTVLGFYDFVTSAQHRTILTMVNNCFMNLQPADYDLISNCLPTLAEHLKESEPRCVERVCSCFVRLISAYRHEPNLLKYIVNSCNLLTNLQSLLTLTPSVLSSIHEVVQILATLCASCPDLAVDLIKHNIADTIYTLLLGVSPEMENNWASLTSCFNGLTLTNLVANPPINTRLRTRSHSGEPFKTSSSTLMGSTHSSVNKHYDVGSLSSIGVPQPTSLPFGWQSLMITSSPLSNAALSNSLSLPINQRSSDDVHALVHLISELLPPISSHTKSSALYSNTSQRSSDLIASDVHFGSGINLNSMFSTSDSGLCTPEQLTGGTVFFPDSSSIQVQSSKMKNAGSSSSVSSNSSSTLLQGSFDSINLSQTDSSQSHIIDPRALLLYDECKELQNYLCSLVSIKEDSKSSHSTQTRRRSVYQKHGDDNNGGKQSASEKNNSVLHRSRGSADNHLSPERTEALQMVQTLLPLLFEVFTETTKTQTRLLCLEAIQRMIFYSSPLLLAKVTHPRVICSHIAGMLNSPETRVILMALQISVMLLDRIPYIFAIHFRKEGILHSVDQLVLRLTNIASTNSQCKSGTGAAIVSKHESPISKSVLKGSGGVSGSSSSSTHLPNDKYASDRSTNLQSSRYFDSKSKRSSVSTPGYHSVTQMEDSSTHNCPVLLDVAQSCNQSSQTSSSHHMEVPMSPSHRALSDSSLVLLSERDPLLKSICLVCESLQTRIQDVLKSLDTPANIHKVELNTFDNHEENTTNISSSCDLIDLMPILVSIAHQLNSDAPNLWIRGLDQLINLFNPGKKSLVSVEPPSPFELQESGVTKALLNFLTSTDNREIRLWIMFRMFLGCRATSSIRFSPTINWESINGRKWNGYKNWFTLLSIVPDLFSSDCNKLSQLNMIDCHLNSELKHENDNQFRGVRAFGALIECLLAYLHRHEHFQVHSIPSMLPPNDKWLSLIGKNMSKNLGNSDVRTVSGVHYDHTVTSPSSSDTTHKSTNQHNVQKGVAVSHSSRPSGKPTSSRISGMRTSTKPPLSSPINYSNKSDPLNSNWYTTNIDPKFAVHHSSNPSARTVQLTSFTPGILRIELHRISDTEKQTQEDGPPLSHSSSSSILGSNTKGGRKSSMSSSSSGHSANTSFSLNTEPCSSLPNFLPLRITALATIQNVERLLLQRNYVNSVLQESGFSHHSDHNFAGIQDAFIDHLPDDDIYGSPQSHLIDEVTDDDDEEDMDSHTHSLLRELGSIEDTLKYRPDIQHSDKHLRASAIIGASHRKSLTPERRNKNQFSQIPKPSVSLPNRNTSASCSSAQIQSAVTKCSRHTKSEMYSKQLSPSSHVPSGNVIHDLPATIPNVQLLSETGSAQNSSKVSISTSSSLQRGLRSLLQRSSEILPLMTRSGIEKANPSSFHSIDSSNTSVTKKVDSRGLRRRSTANVPISDAFCSTSVSPSTSSTTPERVITPFSHFLRSVTNPLVVDDNHTIETSGGPSRRKSKQTVVPKEAYVSVTTTDTETSGCISKPVCPISPTQLPSRYRRLKSGSLLTALGVLASSSVTTNTTSSRKGPVRRGRSGGVYSYHVPQTRSLKNTASPSLSSTSNTSSLLGSEDSFIYYGKLKPIITFYVGGHRLPPDIPLYEAIRKFSPEIISYSSAINSIVSNCSSQNDTLNISEQLSLTHSEKEALIGHLIWSLTHTVQYKVAYRSLIHDTAGSHSRKHNNTSVPMISGCSLSPSSASSSPKGISDNGLINIAPSFPTTLSLSAAITCFKHRRPNESDAEHVDNTEKCPVTSSNHQVADASTSVQKQVTSYGQICDVAQHPLFSYLVSDLPVGFLTDIRCDCNAADSQSTCSMNTDTTNLKDVSDHLSTTLALLRVLNNINRLWYTVHNALDPFPIYSLHSFQSQKLAVKAKRQLQDVFSVLANNLPSWLIQLISVCPFLFPFDIRRTFFYAYNFDRNRALLRFQDLASSYTSDNDQSREHIGARGSTALFSHGNQHNSVAFISNLFGGASGFANSSASSNPASLTTPLDASSQTLFGTQLLDLTSGASSSSQEQNGPDSCRNHLRTRGRYHLRLALSPNFRRRKVTVNRDEKRLLKQAEVTLNEMGDSRAVLEIAFEGEVGFGLGPTLEFYTLISRLLMKSSLSLWHGCETTSDGYLIAPAPGLYPRPFSRQTKSSVIREVCMKFNFLGRLLARALLDWRRLDLPFSPAFFKWFSAPSAYDAVSSGHILPNDLSLVDPDLGRHVRQLTELVNRRQALCRQLSSLDSNASPGSFGVHHSNSSMEIKSSHHSQKIESIKASIVMLDNEVDDLCLNFTLPGYEVELVKNGAHINVTGANLSCYLRLVAHWLVIEGASRQMDAVLKGFDSVLPNIRSRLTTLFQPDEMENLFCGESTPRFGSFSVDQNGDMKFGKFDKIHSAPDEEGWDVQSLTQSCCCDHGYTPQSRAIRFLFEIMSEFNAEQRRLFVQFVTGSPRLPVGGFRALKPPLKIVMKREIGENADNHLPSVMTCQNYLKLPDYSSKELMLSKLLYAIREGQNAFHLS
uniref:E3 ubiquitin-protein ligase n=1 Tax=Trichobilharzia regenti TaxID=157069 RepID=A0AA85JZA2_TRIRE|nr:unnamed protein product [Trichobilharzia regenti]